MRQILLFAALLALLMHSKSWTMNAPAVTESPTHSRVF